MQTCKSLSNIFKIVWKFIVLSAKLHSTQQHPDTELLGHINELIAELEAAGIHASAPDVDDISDEDEEWTDTDDADGEDEKGMDVDHDA